MKVAYFNIQMIVLVVLPVPVCSIKVKVLYKPENDLTCYTCPEKANNTECNKWAPDVYCPYEHTVCKSVHRFNKETGDNVYVKKTCAVPTECSTDKLGCTENENNEIECVSCCHQPYCNREILSALTTSVTLSESMLLNKASPLVLKKYSMTAILIIYNVFILYCR